MQIQLHSMPLRPEIAEEMLAFWQAMFNAPRERYAAILRGEEDQHNRFDVLVARIDGQLAGTCSLTQSVHPPKLGGLGEVATHPDFRKRGIAQTLCAAAAETFQTAGGEILYLATSNPVAMKLYRRMGWRRIANANVMAKMTRAESPEEFMVDYFRTPHGKVQIRPGHAGDRLPLIPLILCPHDDMLLDGNAGFISTRHVMQGSCMGLYPAMQALRGGDEGQWWVAATEDHRAIGLASVRCGENDLAFVDAFTHARASQCQQTLFVEAIRWCESRGRRPLVWCCEEDHAKRDRLAQLGFHRVCHENTLTRGEMTLRCVALGQ